MKKDNLAESSYDHSMPREFLLAKLINAENACYKSKIFSSLDQKTRLENTSIPDPVPFFRIRILF